MHRVLSTALILLAAAAPATAQDVEKQTVTDDAGVVAIDLPPGFAQDPELQATLYGGMAAWRGNVDVGGTSTWCVVFAQRYREYARAELALEVPYERTQEDEIEGSRIEGATFTQIATHNRKGPWLEWRRALERKGRVYAIVVQIGSTDYEATKSVGMDLIGSARVPRPEAPSPLPPGFTEREAKGFRLQTALGSKSREASYVREAVLARKIALEALGGEPFDDSVPVIRVFRNEQQYRLAVSGAGGDPELRAAFLIRERYLAIDATREQPKKDANETFWDGIRLGVALQATFQHFGGNAPMWVMTGLANYTWIGVESGGRVERPKKWAVNKGREVAGTIHRLDHWFPLAWHEVADKGRAAYELWVIHWYLRHEKRAKPYRSAYETYLRVLRETGRPKLAADAWEGFDHDAFREALFTFAQKWK